MDVEPLLERFARQGFARLGKVMTDAAAISLGERATALMTAPEPLPGLFYQPEPASRRFEDVQFGAGWQGPNTPYRKLERLENDPLFMAWISNPLFERLARAHLSTPVKLYRSVLWNKGEHGGMEVPWHQDDGRFWGLDRTPSLQIWTALDPAGEDAGCLEVVPGSHLNGLASPEGGTVQPDQVVLAEAQKLLLPAARGESILVHNHLWHRTAVNRSGAPRRAMSISFLAGDTHCKRRRRAPRTFQTLFA